MIHAAAPACFALGLFPVEDGWRGDDPKGLATIEVTPATLAEIEGLMDDGRAAVEASEEGLVRQVYEGRDWFVYRQLRRQTLIDPDRAILENVARELDASVRALDVAPAVAAGATPDTPFQTELLTDGEKLHGRAHYLSALGIQRANCFFIERPQSVPVVSQVRLQTENAWQNRVSGWGVG